MPAAVRCAVLLASAVLAACASAGGGGPAPAPGGGGGASALPPIPSVTGPLDVRVVYPDSMARIAVGDSNFLFGSTGTGDARLTIDGTSVPVRPNGAFLAWLPVPSPASGDTAVYRLVATRGSRADTVDWPVLLPARPYEGTGPAWIDTASVTGLPERWARPDETLALSVRGAPGARASVYTWERNYAMTEVSPGRYRAAIPARELYEAGQAKGRPPSPAPAADASGREPFPLDSIGFRVELAAGGDTALASGRYPLRLLEPGRLPVAELSEAPDAANGESGVVVGRPLPSGPYLWRFPDRTVAAVDGRVGGRLRIRLGPDLEAWVDTADARLLPSGTPLPEARVGDVHLVAGPEGLGVRLRLGARVPLRVRADGRRLLLTLYGARGRTNRLGYGPADPLLRAARWDQLPGRRWRLELELSRPVWGWKVSWKGGGDVPADGAGAGPPDTGGTLELTVRRPPDIDRDHPLRGRIVAVDPGHPPVGAHGPTGLYEADANLAVARRLADLLRRVGARPVLVREDTLPVGLYERVRRAEAAGAELFVSIHNNALPDGVRPFDHAGTSAYYYHDDSRDLAADLQRGMLGTMGLEDLGIAWGDLAVCRQTWMPAALTEGAFMMIPRQEAALRTAGFQEAYARGVLEGLRAYLASRARRR